MNPTRDDLHLMAYVRGFVYRPTRGEGHLIYDSERTMEIAFFRLKEAARWLVQWPAIRPYPARLYPASVRPSTPR